MLKELNLLEGTLNLVTGSQGTEFGKGKITLNSGDTWQTPPYPHDQG